MKIECPECESFTGRLREICRGTAIVNGETIPEQHANFYRQQWGLAPIGQDQEEWNVTMKSRGFGDTVAKFTHFTGIAAAVQAVSTATGVPCGCGGRQEGWNNALPYPK